MTPPATLSAEEAAELLGCTPRWLVMRVRAGRFPASKINRKWRFSDDDIREILAITRNKVLPQPATSMTAASRRRLKGRAS